jgi:hypothetical protein
MVVCAHQCLHEGIHLRLLVVSVAAAQDDAQDRRGPGVCPQGQALGAVPSWDGPPEETKGTETKGT